MNTSNFANPHGLDVAKLCTYAMKNVQFRKIVNTQSHKYVCVERADIEEKDEPETSGSEKSIESDKDNLERKK